MALSKLEARVVALQPNENFHCYIILDIWSLAIKVAFARSQTHLNLVIGHGFVKAYRFYWGTDYRAKHH